MTGDSGVSDVTYSMVQCARQRIAPYIHRTPLVRSSTLSNLFNANVYLKMEIFQRTGAFKVRGAFNKMLSLGQRASRGVVAVSAGNHAQAVAYAAQCCHVPAVVLLPNDTPQNYVDATRGYGAAVAFVSDLAEGFREVAAFERRGYTFIHPFGDPLVVAGQGSIGLEIHDDLPGVTDVFVSIGGGGLACGTAVGLKGRNPSIRVWGVETRGADSMAQALDAGKIVQLPRITSRAKTLGAPSVSPLTLQLARQLLEEVVVVSDDEATRDAIFLLERTKVLTELAASCTLSALHLRRDCLTPASNVVLVLCGGNACLSDLVDDSREHALPLPGNRMHSEQLPSSFA